MKGIKCPFCNSLQSKVIDSCRDEESVRRRRECKNGHRFRTFESHIGDLERANSIAGRINKLAPRDQRIMRHVLAELEAVLE